MSPPYPSRVSDREGNAAARDSSEATAEQIDQEVQKLLDAAYHLARRVLLADRDKLEGIAKGLLKHETLSESQIKEIVGHDRPINPLPDGVPPPGRKLPAKNPFVLLGLTPREMEVLTWMAQGKTNNEIGVMLRVRTGTICKHVERILVKLKVENRTAAAAVAIAALASAKE